MGRLTLNMLLSFAQFEREIAGERIRDKIAASKAKGMWMGGNVPLGYDVKDRKLIVNEGEAETIRMIFAKYIALGSIRLLKYDLDENGIVSKRRERSGVVRRSGSKFSRGALYSMLRNPIYHGEIGHQGKVYPGQHEAIVASDIWRLVQDKLAGNRHAEKIAATAEAPSLLAGLIEDGDGHRLTSTHAVKASRRYRYYVSKSHLGVDVTRHANQGWRIPAGAIEELVLDRLREFFASGQEIRDAVTCFEHDDVQIQLACSTALGLADGWATLPSIEIRELVQATIEKVIVREEEVAVSLRRTAVASRLLGSSKAPSEFQPDTIELQIDAKLRRAGKGVRLVVGGGIEKPNRRLIAVLRAAHAARNALMTEGYESIDAMAQRLGAKRDHLTAQIRMTYLAPDIVHALTTGRPPQGLTPARLLSVCRELPHDWRLQRSVLGFETR